MALKKSNLKFSNINAKANEAIDGMCIQEGHWSFPCVGCSVAVGYVETPDGRKAQLIVTVTTEEDEWLPFEEGK